MAQRTSRETAQSRMTQEAKEKLEVHYLKHMEHLERWKREHEYNLAQEEKIAAVGKFYYEKTDYGPLLERQLLKERPIPNFDYLSEEARQKIQNEYFNQLLVQGSALIFGLIIMLVTSGVLFWGTALLNLILVGWLYLTAHARQRRIHQAVQQANGEAERRRNSIIEKNLQDRVEHERAEDERINTLQQLLDGERAAILVRLDDVLSQLEFPAVVDVEVDILETMPWVRIMLPAKAVIPTTVSSLASSGKIRYEDKELRQINKQYVEFCTALVMHIVIAIYANIPSVDTSYVQAFISGDLDDECVMELKLDRNTVETVGRANSGLAAVRAAGGRLECGTDLSMEAIKPGRPEGWTEDKQQYVRSLKVRIYR